MEDSKDDKILFDSFEAHGEDVIRASLETNQNTIYHDQLKARIWLHRKDEARRAAAERREEAVAEATRRAASAADASARAASSAVRAAWFAAIAGGATAIAAAFDIAIKYVGPR